MLALRDYQREAIATIIGEASNGVRRQLLQIPTGGGKTVIASKLSERARGRVLMLVHRDELVEQSVEKFGWVWPGEEIGVVKAERNEHDRRVVVASVQTLARGRVNDMDAQSFSLVIVDEAHHAAADSWLFVLERLGVFPETPPGRLLLGITATPSRSDGVGLASIFEKLVFRKTLRELIDAGYLKDVKGVRVETHLDLSRVRVSGGEFNTKDLSLAVDTENRNRLLCEAYERYGEGRKAIIFTVDITHAQHVAEALKARGHQADWVSGELPLKERRRRVQAFEDGDITLLANSQVLCLDEETEILTSQGFVGIDAMTPSHLVANWDDGKITFEHPIEVIRRSRALWERMVSLDTPRRSVRVTEGHGMLYRTYAAGKFRKAPARELVGRSLEVPVAGLAEPLAVSLPETTSLTPSEYRRRIQVNSYNLRRASGMGFEESVEEAARRHAVRYGLQYTAPGHLSLADCEFIGFWLGDGSVNRLGTGGLEYTLVQSSVYPQIVQWVDGVLVDMGVHAIKRLIEARGHVRNPYYRWSLPRGTGFGPQARKGLFRLEPYLDKAGSHLLWGLSEQQFDALIHGLWMADGLHGDGSTVRGAYRFQAAHRDLLFLLQAIAVCRGYRATIKPIKMPVVSHNRWAPQFLLSLKKEMVHRISNGDERWTFRFESLWRPERVWCVRTRTGNIVTRRHGTVTVMGNCEGYDEASIGCIITARPTRAQGPLMQMVGRGLRPYPGLDYCVVLDMADTRQDLAGLGDIEGLRTPAERQSRGRDTGLPSGEREEVRDDHLEDARLVATPLDLLARSAFRWHIETKRRMRLEAGPAQDIVLVRQETGLWEVVLHSRGVRRALVPQALPLDYAQGVAEEHIRQEGLGWFAGKDAQWRSRPASEKQVDLLRSLGIEPEEGMTREAAQDAIREGLRTRALTDPGAPWRQEPATEKQIEWMRKHHYRVHEGMTKGEVAKVMERLKTRQRVAR